MTHYVDEEDLRLAEKKHIHQRYHVGISHYAEIGMKQELCR